MVRSDYAGLRRLSRDALIHFTHGHEVAAFILVLTSAVLMVGASIVHAVHSLREDVAGLRRQAGGAYPP